MFSPVKTVPRQRTASAMDYQTMTSAESSNNNRINNSNIINNITDPITIITRLFVGDDLERLSRALQWIELMVRSG